MTVLTSLDDAQLRETGVDATAARSGRPPRALAQESGLDGVVASPQEIAAIRAACGPDFLIVTPGIRPHGRTRRAKTIRRGRWARPRRWTAGASYLVVGRPITAAADPARRRQMPPRSRIARVDAGDRRSRSTRSRAVTCARTLRETLDELQAGVRLRIEEIDITSDAELFARYRYEIPVLLMDGREVARGRIDERELVIALTASER